MPSIYIHGFDDACVGDIDGSGAIPVIGDTLRIGMPHNYKGRWRVVGREYGITGPMGCMLTMIFVEPVDDTAVEIRRKCANEEARR